MEHCGKKNKRNRRKRRQLKRCNSKFEVKYAKKQKTTRKHYENHQSNHVSKEKSNNCNNFNIMDANAFWENYNAAHEWQNRHNTTWWKTRCYALEHENYVLKETIRNLMQNQNCSDKLIIPNVNQYQCYDQEDKTNDDQEVNNHEDEDLEFHLNEDMMTFLAQSMRHKVELKNKTENNASDDEERKDNEVLENVFEKTKKRSEDAKLLYGEASTKILAMETALQTTIDRHIDKAKPKYWPNIPLKL